MRKNLRAGDDGQFYRGSLKDGQILETEGDIVILGSVEEGAKIISTKDIIVLGRLAGNAYAGGDGRDHHFIAALEMTPQKLKIGDFKYKTKESRLWAGKAPKGAADGMRPKRRNTNAVHYQRITE